MRTLKSYKGFEIVKHTEPQIKYYGHMNRTDFYAESLKELKKKIDSYLNN